MNDTAIIIAFSAAFAAGFLAGRVFPVKHNAALGDEQRVRAGGIDLYTWSNVTPPPLAPAAALLVISIIFSIIIAALLLLPRSAHAGEPYITVGIGKGLLKHPGDNKWWIQKGWDYTIDEDSTVYRLGAGWTFNRYLAIEANYHDLGKYDQFAGFMTAEDHYDASSPNLCVNGCTPTSWGHLRGQAHAISFAALPSYPLNDQARLFGRVGLAWYEATYSFRISSSDSFGRAWTDGGATVRGIAQVFGLGLAYGPVSFEATKFRGVKAGPDSPYQSAFTYTLGYQWAY